MKGPKLTIDDRDYERAKYEEIWRYSDYRQYSPGLKYSERLDLLSILHQNKIRSILDVGCGMGKVISLLLEQGGDPFEVEGFDIAHNCLNPEIVEQGVKLQVGCLWDEGVIDKKFDATICTDVMEHIPTDKVWTEIS
jgi:2-polyprenyl-3-methyl-5-hydroxy-6-metoxy-1,4-benzoquinol methylase